MKKLLLALTTIFCGLNVAAQLTTNWSIINPTAFTAINGAGHPDATANQTSYNGLALNNVASIALSQDKTKLYVADRGSSVQKISIVKLNADNSIDQATPITTLSNANITAGTNKFNKIQVAEDGAIYATSLRNTSGNLYIYRWANESSAPVQTEIVVNERMGDSFAVFGSGANTRIFVSGTGHKVLHVLAVDASGIITKEKTITLNVDNHARGSISPVNATTLWLESPTSPLPARKVLINGDNTVTEIAVVSTAAIPDVFSNVKYYEEESKKFLISFGAVQGSGSPNATHLYPTNRGLDLNVLDITNNEANPSLISSARLFEIPTTPNPNGLASGNLNGYADVAIKKNTNNTHTFFHVVMGYGLAAYTVNTTVLPVSLTSFNASLVKGQSTLTWETASETNNKGFEVLRSTDGKDFTKIDFVNAKGQNGNSSTALNYTYVDRTAKSGLNYYRLKQIDLDGKSELFDRNVSVDVSLKGGTIVAFPNPTTNYVSLTTGGEDYKGFKYELFDSNGKKVLSEKAKATQQDVSLSKLPAAVYFLKVSKNDIEQQTIKLIKQ
ncbi:hypothetical protein D3C87_377920 [compost metagenome]